MYEPWRHTKWNRPITKLLKLYILHISVTSMGYCGEENKVMMTKLEGRRKSVVTVSEYKVSVVPDEECFADG